MAEDAILGFLQSNDEIADSREFAAGLGIDHIELENVIKRLNGFEIVDAQDFKKDNYLLTEEGKLYAVEGSPEVNFFLSVPPEGISLANLKAKFDPEVFKIGSSRSKKNNWIEIAKGSVTRKPHLQRMKLCDLNDNELDQLYVKKREQLKQLVTSIVCRKIVQGKLQNGNDFVAFMELVNTVEDKVKDLLKGIEDGKFIDGNAVTELLQRKLIVKQTWRGYKLRKGPKYVSKRKKAATDLTREHLQKGDWKDLEFKEYNLNAQGQPIQIGYLQPLLEVREEIQNIFLQMGFEEMPTNNFVESSFWNFDALFQPQQHPARDSHDTFFLKAPATTRDLPEDYVERVKRVHEVGGYGSKGYGYDWKRDEADKNLLRTHTTAVSTRMLYMLAQKKPFTPKRYYSIDRVFRNEAVDRTHLAEFHQIEGLICDHGLTLGDLIGVLEDFFARLGMSKLRFKPAYNPYTEPSMEIFSYHDGLKKWVEVGNSGMFRPEMLLPMGLPEDVNVIAWGLSLERPTMILYGIDNIRDLFGPKVDFNIIKSRPICRLGLQ